MRIAFTGASGTGKTSVARALISSDVSNRHNLRLINGDSRGLLRLLGLGLANMIAPEEYKIFQTMYIGHKLMIEEGQQDYVTERSFADGLIYWRLHCAGTASAEENSVIERVCRHATARYDLHFLFPTGLFALEDDGFRHTNSEYHQSFEAELRETLADFEVLPIVMPIGSVRERVEFLLEHLT